MDLLRSIRRRFRPDDRVVNLYNCEGCSNVFTKTWEAGERPPEVACPNCGSTDVVVAVESP